MNPYIPPYTITNEILERVSSIMKKIGKLDNYQTFNRMPILRRNNRIKSIHSSLAIEANSLSFEQVKDIIDGKRVMGPKREIQEVQNAYLAYSKIEEVNPYSVTDLKMMHGLLTQFLLEDAGHYRKGGEGVFDESGHCIFVCPPASQVDVLMNQLFDWMKKNKNKIHPLILASIFHYEFVFIHPFKDGNGRTARLWQNVLLAHFEPLFLYVPIESEIKKYQDDYYKVIRNCNKKGESTEFIAFMLKMIDEVLGGFINGVNVEINHVSTYVNKLLNVMQPEVRYKTSELMNLLNMKSRVSFKKNYLSPALLNGVIKMTLPDTPTSKNQRYYKSVS